MGDPSIEQLFDDLLKALSDAKSPARTERDRYLAIEITEIEKVRAHYLVYASDQPEFQPYVNWNK